jgi:hypothetical protein
MIIKNGIKYFILIGVILIAIVGSIVIGPVAQNPDYHVFSDQRTILSVPNFWNVVTNFPFVVVGIMGMILTGFRTPQGGLPELKWIYLLFFLGVFATGLGSGYYHYSPTNETLVWDRIPITVSFMAIFCAIVGESISLNLSRKLILPLLVLGVSSVIFWYISEKHGVGDLRLYALVQYFPIVLIPLILLFFNSRLTPLAYVWAVLGCYVIAKIGESLDGWIYSAVRIMSGHPFKHLAAAFGTYLFYRALQKREIRGE